MHRHKYMGFLLAGLGAGAVTGLFGAGGGMVLIPLLSALTDLDDRSVFPASICIILPICLTSLAVSFSAVKISTALPFLLGSALGGVVSGIWGQKIPVKWLHRGLGLLILWGGVRYLC